MLHCKRVDLVWAVSICIHALQDSPMLKLCYLSLWLALFRWKTLLVEKTVIVEIGESQPWHTKRCDKQFFLITQQCNYNWTLRDEFNSYYFHLLLSSKEKEHSNWKFMFLHLLKLEVNLSLQSDTKAYTFLTHLNTELYK